MSKWRRALENYKRNPDTPSVPEGDRRTLRKRLTGEMAKGQPQRRNKYGARKVKLDGFTFDSQAEADRYVQLKLMERAGEIGDLQVHPRYELVEAFTDRDGRRQRAVTYVADFAYMEAGQPVVEDVKGGKATQTPVFKLKAKLFLRRYPEIAFRIVER